MLLAFLNSQRTPVAQTSSGIDSSLYSPLSTYGSLRPDHAAVHRRPGDERLERRAQVVLTLHRTVDEDRLVGVGLPRDRVDLLAEQLVELVAVDRAHPAVVEPSDSWPSPRSDRWSSSRRRPRRPAPCTGSTPGRRTPSSWRTRACRRSGSSGRSGCAAATSWQREVGRQAAPLLELGLQRLLGVLLHVEVDGQLDVLTGDRVDVLIDQLANDAAGGVDLEDLLAPLTVQRVLHRLPPRRTAPTSSLVL